MGIFYKNRIDLILINGIRVLFFFFFSKKYLRSKIAKVQDTNNNSDKIYSLFKKISADLNIVSLGFNGDFSSS